MKEPPGGKERTLTGGPLVPGPATQRDIAERRRYKSALLHFMLQTEGRLLKPPFLIARDAIVS